MKRSALILLATSAIAVFLGERAHADANCGTFKSVIKDVKVTKQGGSSATEAKQGAKVCQGDTIAAGADSRANILMEDGNNLNLSPNTSLVIEAYGKKKVVLNVLGGKLRSAISDKNKYDGNSSVFQVKTKSAVAGVRGTDFLTTYTPSTGKTEIVTFSGKVEVGQIGSTGQPQNPVSVSAGQKTEAAIGQPPSPPSAVPAAELKQLSTTTASAPPQPSAPGPAGAAAPSPKSDEPKQKQDGAPVSDRGPRGESPDRTPAGGGTPGGGSPGPGSMVGAGETSGEVTVRDSYDRKPADRPLFTAPNAQLPVTYVPPSSVTDTLNNTGPTLLRVRVEVK